jgi:hypothetical protein
MAWQWVATGERDANRAAAASRGRGIRLGTGAGRHSDCLPRSVEMQWLATMRKASRRIATSQKMRRVNARMRTSSACRFSDRSSCSWRGPGRARAGQGGPVAQGINAYAQVEGNMGHGNARGPCQQEGLVMEYRAIR